MFFNLVFADYDVTPATVNVTTIGGAVLSPVIATQPGAQDGLIQAAALNLNFTDVFQSLNATTWEGELRVDFVAPNEPYTAFDYVEVSTRPIPTAPIPEPLTLLAVFAGGTAVAGYVRKRRAC